MTPLIDRCFEYSHRHVIHANPPMTRRKWKRWVRFCRRNQDYFRWLFGQDWRRYL